MVKRVEEYGHHAEAAWTDINMGRQRGLNEYAPGSFHFDGCDLTHQIP